MSRTMNTQSAILAPNILRETVNYFLVYKYVCGQLYGAAEPLVISGGWMCDRLVSSQWLAVGSAALAPRHEAMTGPPRAELQR